MEQRAGIVNSYRRECGFAVAFMLLFSGLQYGYTLCRGTPLEHLVIDTLTVRPAAFLINLIAPLEHVQAMGHSLISPSARLNVLNGCEGVESILLVVSALLAYTLPWATRICGALLAAGLLYALNQVRLAVLYFTASRHDHAFILIHGYVGPTLVIAVGALFFFWWVSRHPAAEP